MSETNSTDTTTCKDVDLEDGVPESALSPDIHELREVDHHQILDLSAVSVYLIENECKYCQMGFKSHDILGDVPTTDSEFENMVYELYESFYSDPRSISHAILLSLSPVDENGPKQKLAGYLGKAVDLGCEDRQSERSKKSREEVLDFILPK